jgi:hypothetical protein
MAKKGSYLGGSTVIKTKPWLAVGNAPREGRLGLVGIAAADADAFVPKTYVLKAEEKARRASGEAPKSTAQARTSALANRKAKSLAKAEERQADPKYQEKAAAIQAKQAKKMSNVRIERKRASRSLIKKTS